MINKQANVDQNDSEKGADSQNMQSQMFQKFEDFFYGFWILNQTQIKWFVQNQTWVGIFSSNRVMIYKRW